MIKFKETAIKTMADAVMAGNREPEETSPRSTESSEEIVFLNRKLREAFKISIDPKSAPAPHFSSFKSEPDKTGVTAHADDNPPLPTKDDFLEANENIAEKGRTIDKDTEKSDNAETTNQKNLEDLKKIKEELERQQKANETKEAEEKSKQQAKIAGELETEKQRVSEEKAREAAREAEEKAAKETERLLKEEKRKEEEKQAAQEKLRQEKLKAQIEAERKREERRKQLAELEAEREKEKLRRTFEEKKKREEEEKQAALKSAKKPENNPPAQTLLTALERLIGKLRAQKLVLEKQLSTFPDTFAPLRIKKTSLESKIGQIKSTDLAAAIKSEDDIEELQAAEKTKLNGQLSIEQEKIIEQKLWEIDERRKEAEKKRWGIEDGINKIAEEIATIESRIEEGKAKETAVNKKIKTISGQIKMVVFAQEKWKMEQEMLTNVNERETITPSLETALSKKNSIAAKMQELTDREKSINSELTAIEQKEKQTSDPSEKRTAEQERWQVGEKLKSTIQSKWEAEEKLRGEETGIQEFQGKIDNINKKISRIQNIISRNEAELEGEGLPIHRIRDEIKNLFKENSLEIDSDLLGEIIQPEDLTSSRGQEPEAKASPTKSSLAKPQPPLPVSSVPNGTGIENGPSENKNGPMPAKEPAKAPEPPKTISREAEATSTHQETVIPAQNPVRPAAPPIAAAPKEETRASASRPIPAQIPVSSKQATESVAKEPDVLTVHPKETDLVPPPAQNIVPETTKLTAEPIAAEIKKTIPPTSAPTSTTSIETPLPGAIESQIKDSFLTPETKLADIIKNGRPELKTERIIPGITNAPGMPAAGSVVTPEASPAYMEQITVTPAANIRSFAPEEKAAEAAAPATRIQRGPTEEDMQILGNASKEDLDVFGAENPTGDVWGDRWGQIKKTTTPSGSPTGITVFPPGAIPNTPSDPMAPEQEFAATKPNGNKTLVRVIVVLVLVGIIGIAITLVLLKNNSPAPSGNGDDPKKEEVAGKNGGEEETSIETNPKTTLAVLDTKIIPIEDITSIPNVIFPFLQSPYDADGYYRLVIQNKKDKTAIGLRQFLSVFKVTAPAAFYSSASDDFTLFIYSSKGKNRLGFVTATDNAASLKAAMTSWEPNMVTNTDNLFKFLGRKTQSVTATLKFDSDATADNIQYRALAFSPATDNYSIAYTVYKDKYLIFSTSNEALIKIFGQLPK